MSNNFHAFNVEFRKKNHVFYGYTLHTGKSYGEVLLDKDFNVVGTAVAHNVARVDQISQGDIVYCNKGNRYIVEKNPERIQDKQNGNHLRIEGRRVARLIDFCVERETDNPSYSVYAKVKYLDSFKTEKVNILSLKPVK